MIRSRWWDAIWIMNGPVIGLVLILLSMFVSPKHITVVILGVFGMAHRISPMALAVAHPGLRKIVRAYPLRFIWLPLLIISFCAAVGWFFPKHNLNGAPDISWQTFTNDFDPLFMIGIVYLMWNAWHFGMQNFGVLSIYRAKEKSGHRKVDQLLCLGFIVIVTFLSTLFKLPPIPTLLPWVGTLRWVVVGLAAAGAFSFLLVERRFSWRSTFAIIMAATPVAIMWWAPLQLWAKSNGWMLDIPFWVLLWSFAMSLMNHYLVAIGLSSHVWSRQSGRSYWWFVAAMLVVGTALSICLFINPLTLEYNASGFTLSLLLGISFTHFLYDGGIWGLSDPLVRAAIGPDLLGPPKLRLVA